MIGSKKYIEYVNKHVVDSRINFNSYFMENDSQKSTIQFTITNLTSKKINHKLMKYFESHPIVNQALNAVNTGIPENLVKIHDRLYNLAHFDHPGGNMFIRVCCGKQGSG